MVSMALWAISRSRSLSYFSWLLLALGLLRRCPPWGNGVQQSVLGGAGRGRQARSQSGSGGRRMWAFGAQLAQRLALNQRPAHLSKRVWRVQYLDHAW